MDTLTYFIIAVVVFVVIELTVILLTKKFSDGDCEPGMVFGFTLGCLLVSATWMVSVPVCIVGGLLYLFSRLISNWLNK